MTKVLATLKRAIAELEGERNRLDEQIHALHAILRHFDGAVKTPAMEAKVKPRTKRRGMTAQMRKSVSQRMKAYWAKRRAAVKKQKGIGKDR